MGNKSLLADKRNRVSEYDIIKGICILLVAIMHTGHPVYFLEYGFLFAFFFVSGCTFKRKPFLQFLKGKLLRIYIPFVLANFAGYFIGKFYYGLSGYGGYGYSLPEATMRIFSFQIAENIMSPSWFLLPMFLVVFIFYFLHALLDKVKYRDEIILGGSFVLFLAGLYFRGPLSSIIWNKCSVVYSLTYALFFCALGYYYHNHPKVSEKIISGKYSAPLFVASLVFMNEVWSHYEYTLNIRYGEASSGAMTVIVSILGVFFIVFLAGCMAKMALFEKVFCLLGRHSLAIMLFHIISYGVVTIALHYIMGWDYPVTWAFGYYSEKISYVNALAGVAIPTIVAEGFAWIKKSVKKNLFILGTCKKM